jgi:hypothetical protein
MRLAVVLVIALPSIASAQAPGAYDPTPPLAPPGMSPLAADTDEPPLSAPSLTSVAPPPAPELSPIERAARRDAADDRAYGTSTALVVPQGQVDASLRVAPFGGVLSVAAGLGGGLELSADVGGIVADAGMGTYGVSAKLALVRRYGWTFAVLGGYHKAGDGENGDAGLYNVGAVVSGCTDRDCSGLISIGAGVMGSTQDSSSDSIPYAWGSLLLGTGGFRPIIEGAVLQGGVLGFVGARMGGRRAALDLGLGFLGADGGEGGGLPIAALSVRP